MGVGVGGVGLRGRGGAEGEGCVLSGRGASHSLSVCAAGSFG